MYVRSYAAKMILFSFKILIQWSVVYLWRFCQPFELCVCVCVCIYIYIYI